MAQMVENSPAVQEIWVQSLGWEEPLEKGMTTHASVRVSEIPWTEEPGGLQSVGSQSRAWLSDYTFSLSHLIFIGMSSFLMCLALDPLKSWLLSLILGNLFSLFLNTFVVFLQLSVFSFLLKLLLSWCLLFILRISPWFCFFPKIIF